MPKEAKQAAKAEQILQGALQEFLQGGYAATSMARIAATAGVSKETLYSYFESKEKLFAAIVQYTAEQHLQQVFASEPLPTDPVEQLRILAAKSITPENLDPMRMNFYRLIVGESGRFPDLARFYVEQFEKPGLEVSAHLLKAAPQLCSSDPEAVAWIISGTLSYYYQMMEMLQGKDILDMTFDRLVEALIELLFGDR
ncbi:TetR/AcrR family transcriptional regulator [Trichocoleus sp. FACHB-591]|uniref:TetR/AcrR family transcriptional regulator n=1 Tax=unclassified Trichocoleus TaxID=2628910 RepID=UPI0016844B62|nr:MULTISPECIES: TetR/AcrR family transcriptional regulator [unclassified Trichocoleus]MBD2093734.1 TetR/AcrR family transcriptional regulator [Trichocoleus sp. FACHB-591]MBD2120999.1 TetR/AcrR family transcriptional regulator [Trichocoleus sp. FACHB-262]